MRSKAVSFRQVLKYAIGGGWGSDRPTEKNTVAVAVIRGTDFGRLSERRLGDVPRRFESASKVAKRALEAGDIVLEVSGGSPARGQTTGRTCFINDRVLAGSATPVIPASFCRLVRVDRRLVLPRFAYFWLQDMYKSGRAGEYENQSTGISNFQFEHFLDAERLELPPLHYQRQVVDVLGSIDDRIDNLRQANATLETITQALFKSWFVDFDPVRAKAEGREPEGLGAATAALFPSGFEDSELGPIPKGWCVKTIGDRASVVDCLHAKKPELLPEGRPYLQLNCIREDGLLETAAAAMISDVDYAKWTSRIEVSPGDCVITNVGRVGAVAQVPSGFKAALGRNMTGIRPGDGLPPTFLIELLMSNYMRREIEQKTDAGTILSALNVKNIPKLRFVCPGEDTLNRFEDVARPLRAAMEGNLRRSAVLSDLRNTLLPRLISGKLRLPEAEAQVQALA